MRLGLRRLFRDEQGQDLAEYSLIAGFIVLVAAVVFVTSGGSVSRIWSTASSITSSASALFAGPAPVTSAEHRDAQ